MPHNDPMRCVALRCSVLHQEEFRRRSDEPESESESSSSSSEEEEEEAPRISSPEIIGPSRTSKV